MNTYLAWFYTNKGARLMEVPVSEGPDLGGLSAFEKNMISYCCLTAQIEIC